MAIQNPDSQRHIFLVDDDDDDRAVFADALRELDNSVNLSQAQDGTQCMEMLSATPSLPDVVFLDVNMPKKNGFECLEEIRNDENLKKLNVIIFSTCNSPETIDRARKLGATCYATKPNSFNDLKLLIKNILQTDWLSSELKNRKFKITPKGFQA